MATPEEYQAKAAEALVQLGEAKGDAERTRLKRAHGAGMVRAVGARAGEQQGRAALGGIGIARFSHRSAPSARSVALLVVDGDELQYLKLSGAVRC